MTPVAESAGIPHGVDHPLLEGLPEEQVLARVTLVCGIIAAVIGVMGIISPATASVSFGSLFSSSFPMTFSTAAVWIFFGFVLAYHAARREPAEVKLILELVIIFIVIMEALELPLNVLGSRFIVGIGGRAAITPISGQSAVPFFPVAPLLIIVTALALLILVNATGRTEGHRRIRNALGLAGGFVALVSLIFVLGYIFGVPFLYGTPFIPLGASSALAAFFIGSGMMTVSGPSAIPVRYFIGITTRARLLRTFVPLVFLLFLVDNIVDFAMSSFFNLSEALFFAIRAVVFAVLASMAFAWASRGVSRRLEDEEQKRKQSENALVEANRKLNLLNSITRHDILNQLMVIDGYLGMAREDYREDPKMLRYFDRVILSTKMIERQISFTKFYQELGVQAPAWHRVQRIAESVSRMTGFEKLQFTYDTGALEIYADPLFEKVFFNLFDNAVRHGEHVTEIRIRFEEREDAGVLLVEDNGIGVVNKEKTLIFRRGFGKHTGFGLFLTREILAITGITIRENGEPGQGARFEIHIPKNEFRFAEP
jgi:signal transduction histidine kinase